MKYGTAGAAWVSPALMAAAALGIGAVGYLRVVRPWMQAWGARSDEVARPLPGDDLVPEAQSQATHAISIAAPPEAVWPWLVQLGWDRAGWYSYDWLDHEGIPSADTILPQHQRLEVGDRLAMTRDGALSIPVVAIAPHRSLVLGGREESASPFAASWVFVLEPTDAGGTRLLVRFRADFPLTLAGRLMLAAIEPAHFIMQRKQLLNLKVRGENHLSGEDRRGVRRDEDHHGAGCP